MASDTDDLRAKAAAFDRIATLVRDHKDCLRSTAWHVALQTFDIVTQATSEWVVPGEPLARLEEPRGAGVTHEQARRAVRELVTDVSGLAWELLQEHKALTAYIAQQADIERRARAAVVAWRAMVHMRGLVTVTPNLHGGRDVRTPVRRTELDVEMSQLADALGEERG